jgi:hypothetical protein
MASLHGEGGDGSKTVELLAEPITALALIALHGNAMHKQRRNDVVM